MSQRVTRQFPAALLAVLQQGCLALLLTSGADGYPAAAYTWTVAVDALALRFAYEWPPDQREAMQTMEQAVYAEMSAW